MSKNKKFVLIVVLIIILIILILVGWSYFKNSGQIINLINSTPADQSGKLPATTDKNINITPTLTPEQKLDNSQAEVKRFAASFAERFGSYSNESNFENVEDSKIMMTDQMANWANGYIKDLRQAQDPKAPYSGITTKALSVEFSSFDENLGQAKVTVICQKIESKGSTANPKVFYQDLTLDLKKTDSGWRIDSAKWEK